MLVRSSRVPSDCATLPTVDIERPALINHVFVYGTLRPGDVRWSFLEPFVTDGGIADSVVGKTTSTREMIDSTLIWRSTLSSGTEIPWSVSQALRSARRARRR